MTQASSQAVEAGPRRATATTEPSTGGDAPFGGVGILDLTRSAANGTSAPQDPAVPAPESQPNTQRQLRPTGSAADRGGATFGSDTPGTAPLEPVDGCPAPVTAGRPDATAPGGAPSKASRQDHVARTVPVPAATSATGWRARAVGPVIAGTASARTTLSHWVAWLGATLSRLTGRLPRDAGMSTAEYAVGTIAACAFAAVLFKVVTSGAVLGLLQSVVTRALHAL